MWFELGSYQEQRQQNINTAVPGNIAAVLFVIFASCGTFVFSAFRGCVCACVKHIDLPSVWNDLGQATFTLHGTTLQCECSLRHT